MRRLTMIVRGQKDGDFAVNVGDETLNVTCAMLKARAITLLTVKL